MMRDESFEVTLTGRDAAGVRRLAVGGDVDMGSAPALQAALCWALADSPSRLEVNLGAVTYFSSAGLQVLLAARHHAGDTLPVVGAGRPVRRLLEILQLQPAHAGWAATRDEQLPARH